VRSGVRYQCTGQRWVRDPLEEASLSLRQIRSGYSDHLVVKSLVN